MLTASSPINFPPTSPPNTKRSRPMPSRDGPPQQKPKVRGGFVLDDSSDDDDGQEDELNDQPPLKKLLTTSSAFPSQSLPDSLPTESLLARSRIHDESAGRVPISNATRNNNDHFSIRDTLPAIHSPAFYDILPRNAAARTYTLRSDQGKTSTIKQRLPTKTHTFENIVAARTKTKEGRAKRGYYGIDINELMEAASQEIAQSRSLRAKPTASANETLLSVEHNAKTHKKSKRSLLWTEKYRARTFMDLCGDDSTNRMVLRWLKRWDPVVFPGIAKKPSVVRRAAASGQAEDEKPHRKILMLTGPPGLGKTTLAHVCARQAGYEAMEINASDERSRDVVKNRIRTSLGTESVKTVENKKLGDGDRPQKIARPACVIVDEVDGVVAGSGGSGEGGFVKALIDLVLLDQKNSGGVSAAMSSYRGKKKGDDFRLMRPLILICNDVYHPSLKPLRQSGLSEIIHVGKPTIESVVTRLKSVFDKEGLPCEKDAARKICEAAWGITNGLDARKGAQSGAEGDLRGVMVVGEWVAGRFRASRTSPDGLLTRDWLERHVLQDLANGAGGGRGLGRGSAKDIVQRVFQEGGGFPKQALDVSATTKYQHEQPKEQLGFSEHHKKNALERLQHMINTSGDVDRIITDVMLEYPNREFNDDMFLTKPNEAYDWVHFHDACSSRIFSSQEWELAPYISQPVLACHSLFASSRRHVLNMGYDKKWGDAADDDARLPFSGPRADFEAYEAEKQNRAMLQAVQGQLTPSLMRAFRSPEDISTDFLPYLMRLVSPDVKPVVLGGSGDQKGIASVRKESEKKMVRRAAEVLADVGVTLQRGKVEDDSLVSRGPQYVYRLEPDLDILSTFETGTDILSSQAPTRYAVRQVLDQELQANIARRDKEARQARFQGGAVGGVDDFTTHEDKENAEKQAKELEKQALIAQSLVKKDFFGRVIEVRSIQELELGSSERDPKDSKNGASQEPQNVWVTFHEGWNNAVRKPVSLAELLRGL